MDDSPQNTLEPAKEDLQPVLRDKTGHEFWREQEKAEREGLTQEQFDERMNNPYLYQWENPNSRRSHKPKHQAKSIMRVHPVLDAVFRQDLSTLKSLLRDSADVNALDRDGRSPLFQAITQGNTDIVNELLKVGADVNLQDYEERTPLHFTAIHFRPTIAAILLAQGAQVDATDIYGNTPLNNAIRPSEVREDIIKLLLEHDANPHKQNHYGVSPLALAQQMDRFNLLGCNSPQLAA